MAEVLVIAAATFLVDQWTKNVMRLHLRERTICLGPMLRIRYALHRNVAYDHTATRVMFVLLWLAAIAASITLHLSGDWLQRESALWGLGLAFGGAAANLLDILRLRHIVNFIELRAWSVFNVADAAIVTGLCVAIASQI